MKDYKNTDEILHLLYQTIAKVNRTYVHEEEDDSHTNLYFNPLSKRIYGRWFEIKDLKYILAFSLESFSFDLLNEKLDLEFSINSVGKTTEIIERDLEGKLKNIGIPTDGLNDDLHFEITKYSFSSDPIKALSPKQINEWILYRTLANSACVDLLGLAQHDAEVRIWPHHFDTGIYFKAKNDMAVGFGLAMEDQKAGSPYFYISAYPEGKDIEYKDLPQGKWKWEIGESWKGAFLKLDSLEQNPSTRKNDIDEFINSVYKWIICH
ncbi:MAG TPA: hypothetical protein DDX92_07710 [Flavobacteriales bacterium]|jgi:hypothetical protein|nr:hypothetical protein [Flavobacteriales bacterium]